jgi:two-component system cell cycle response regulator DivK
MKTKKAKAGAKANILIVDDDPQILDLFGALLEKAGYEVNKAEHALAAVAAVVRSAPDLILADIRMPIVDGKELAHELKSHPDSREIPVIAVTGYDAPGTRESALKAGYDDYVTKPIDAKTFPDQVAGFLKRFKPKKK